MFFKIAKFLVYLYIRILFRIEVSGMEKIPETGGMIICANHLNAHDPLVIATTTKRRIFFLGKKELFRNKLLSRLFIALGAYPVDRGAADMRAFKWVMKLLEGGNGVGIFFQGHRVKDDEDVAAKNGAALFALKAQVPIVPCRMIGSYNLFSKVRMVFGEPVCLDEYYGQKPKMELLSLITEKIVQRLEALE